MRLRPPRPEDFHSPAHTPAVSARIGLWLGVAFTVCFLTGLLSHAAQHPPGWFTWPTRPVSLYRITQGAHVISGVAAIPLLLAKLWSVYPHLFIRPPLRPPGLYDRDYVRGFVVALFAIWAGVLVGEVSRRRRPTGHF